MKSQKLIDSKAFALCFMKGGGIMSIGGAEPTIQSEAMLFVPLTKPGGWYTVKVSI